MVPIYNPFDNPEFRREFNETLDAKLRPLTIKVDEHEAVINKGKGIMWLGGVVVMLLDPLVHWLFRKV